MDWIKRGGALPPLADGVPVESSELFLALTQTTYSFKGEGQGPDQGPAQILTRRSR